MRIWHVILLACAAVASGIETAAAEAPPAFPMSVAPLEAALDRYRAIEAQGGWPTIPDDSALQAGSSGPAVARLKKHLAVTKDLDAPADGGSVFDADLTVAVKAFQSRHGLRVDGVVGRNTRAALNVPVDARVQQIVTNLQRLKSLPPADGGPAILINVAAFELSVVAHGRAVFTSPVIVGRLSRQTPVFSSAITKVIVNPYWHIPRLIAVKDILPKIKRDPSYLRSQSIRVYPAAEKAPLEIRPETIAWNSLNPNNFPYRLVQDPGPENALGRVKFFLPNDHDIYLHDTPARELFNHEQRTFSSGCIRVGKALELAEYLLRRDGSRQFEAMASALQHRETAQIDLAAPVPINIVYLTAWADRDGRVQFRNDVYALDDVMIAAKPAIQRKQYDVARAYDRTSARACGGSDVQPDTLR